MLLIFEGKSFNLGIAIIWLLVLLVLSVPVGFIISFFIRRWNERHPIEEADDEKRPLKLND